MYLNQYLLALSPFFNPTFLSQRCPEKLLSSHICDESLSDFTKLDFLPSTSFKYAIQGQDKLGLDTLTQNKDDGVKAFVLWHGLGDRYDSEGLQKSADIIKSVIPDAFVHSVYLDVDPSKDERQSVLGLADNQVDFVCTQLSNITELANGFGAIGFSQGGLFLRAIVERCPNVTVSKLITFGSPHMGVLELPLCPNPNDWICKRRNAFLKNQVWNNHVQNTIIPAQYFRDTVQYKKYLKHSRFLADLNNERPLNISADARERFLKLEKLVLIKFSEDTTLVPKESAFFEELDPATGAIIPFDQTQLYNDDYVGLKSLHLDKKIDFYTVSDIHMRFLKEFFKQIVETYFT